MKPSHKPEAAIERYLRDSVKAIGGKAIKMIPTFENGIPDRQVLYNGISVFVELKKVKANPRPLQLAYTKELEAQGFKCFVIRTREEVDQLISYLVDEDRARSLQTSEGRR